jgi:exopolyphosphatase/guanosine-5'-triphosphate,3'-diphosphate pyrophosphatase
MVSAHNKEYDSFPRPDSTGRGPYAVIDLGSYTCRLLVVSRWEHCLETIEVFSRFTRLGEGISRSNLLSEEAIARTTQALVQCANRIQQHAPIAMRAVTTEAVRRAQNKDDFLKHIRKNTGISLEIISQEQEAKFALKGCAGLLDSSYPYGLVFDIGGGSTEITWVLQKTGCAPEVLDWISLPFGVVTIAEDYYTDQANDYRLVRENTCNLLENFTERNNIRQYILENQVQILGTSGTATTALALHQGLKRYERTKIDGMMFKYPDIYKVIKIVQMMSTQERNYNRCIGIGRAELVLGGLAILEGLCNIWPVGVMKVADRGVREGIATDIAFGKDSPLVYEPYERLEVAA